MSTSPDHDELLAAEGIFREYLRDHGLKYTPERQAVLHGVMANEHHFEADQLLVDLRADDKRVAKATIYRTLPLLVDCGLLKAVQFGEKGTRYEHTYGHRPHDHMVCQRCGRIVEFDSTDAERLGTTIAAEHGFQAVSHRFQIVGLCSDCAKTDTEHPAPEREAFPPAARADEPRKTPDEQG